MKNAIVAVAVAALAVTALAQTPGPSGEPIVANINGEVISKTQLDALYEAMTPQVREQYDKAGGKRLFLENYIAKRLLLQEAVRAGFRQHPDVQAAAEASRESVMFDRYVREVVAANIVTDAAVQKVYDDQRQRFVAPERVNIRYIFLSLEDGRPEQVLEEAQQIFSELQAHRVTFGKPTPESRAGFSAAFAHAARKYSDDPNAKDGGNAGWIVRGERDPKFENAAFSVPVGVMSGIVGTDYGYYFILVEDKKPAGPVPFEEVRDNIRNAMLAQKQSEVMAEVTRITNELRAKGDVVVYTANVD